LLDSFGIPLLSNPAEIMPNDVFSKVYSANVPVKKLTKSNPNLAATVLSITKYGKLFNEILI
jgi:hypothetical protein